MQQMTFQAHHPKQFSSLIAYVYTYCAVELSFPTYRQAFDMSRTKIKTLYVFRLALKVVFVQFIEAWY